ncbi:MAG: hypothetical protein L0387_32435 [Acidobacteria bacterium]|nr:hypothetical protein [Acidobacteriota bacterium]
MKKKVTSAMLAFLITAVCTLSTGLSQGKKATLTGHLVDQMCGGEMKDAAKAADHSKECALMDHCASSGFGIFADGKYVKFDAEGSKKAKALVEKTKKEKDIVIVAEGTLDGSTLTVASLKEK